MKALKNLALAAATIGTLASTPAAAYEFTAWVPVANIYVFSNGTNRTYYLYSSSSWGFTTAGCTNYNGNFIQFSSTDASAKDWYALAMAAKVTGALIQVAVTDCTTITVAQVGMK